MKIARIIDASGREGWARRMDDGSYWRIEGDLFGRWSETGEAVEAARLLAPVRPSQILCTGLNYRKHAEETKGAMPEYPVLFFKGVNAVQHPGAPIQLPRHLRSDRVDYECELAVVIGRDCKNVSRGEAGGYILGYTCANDVSARDWQIGRGGGQWCRGKTFDTFCPLGPWLVTPEEIPDPGALRIRTVVSGETLQDWTTADMIFDVPSLIEFFSGSTTLVAGTVLLTGTPHGVGMARQPRRFLVAGDVVRVEIEGIGVLENPVEEEPV